MRITVLHAFVGLFVGVGVGAIVGFVTFAVGEKLHGGGGNFGMILVPTGPLRVGLFGAMILGVVGAAIGLVTGIFGLRPLYAAALGVLIFVVMGRRGVWENIHSIAMAIRGRVPRGFRKRHIMSTNLLALSLALEYAIIGVLISLSLRLLFAS